MIRLLFSALVGISLGCALADGATAHEYRLGALRIGHPWAAATPQGAKVGAGYMTISNQGAEPDRLVMLSASVARKAAVHASVKDGDIVRMRVLENGLEIKPGETVELKPEGAHVMFEDLTGPLTAGERVKAALQFEKAGRIEVEFAVEPLGTRAPAPAAIHQH